MTRKITWIASVLVVLVALALGSTAMSLLAGTYSIDFGTPGKKGTQTTSMTVSYTDPNGKKQEKKITATTEIPSGTTADAKKALVQAELDGALNDAMNQVDGNSLAATGGTGDVMTMTPSANPAGNTPAFTGAKIDSVTTSDKNTGETDVVTRPAQDGAALGSIEIVGDITGLDIDQGASIFSVITNVGVVSVKLIAGMRRIDVLNQLAKAISAQGATVWLDSDRVTLFVLLTGDITGLGAGSTDAGVTAVVKSVTTSDKNTGGADVVTRPAQDGAALGSIEIVGDITGLDIDQGASNFSVITNVGVVSVKLIAGMRRIDVLNQLATGISAQGATVWLDSDRVTLFVLLTGDITGLGAGSTDAGVTAVAEVMAR